MLVEDDGPGMNLLVRKLSGIANNGCKFIVRISVGLFSPGSVCQRQTVGVQ